jgi:Family of unknown function (DUF6929)
MLRLQTVRELDLAEPAAGGHAHLSAASGVVRRGNFLYVIGDDQLDLAVFTRSSDQPGRLVPLFEGELPDEERERGAQKPDLEALTVLPPFERNPYGALLALGSGTGQTREQGFVWSLEADGSLIGFPRLVDLAGLYDFLRAEVPEMNIEGVAALGEERLALFQRGNSEAGKDLAVHLSLREVLESLTSDFRIDPSELLEVRSYELGKVGGVDLAFTDADSLPDGSVVFTAAAEPYSDEHPASDNTGSAVGLIDSEGNLARLEPVEDESIKLEGVDAILADRMIDLRLVCDADDPEVPSPLLAGTLTLG